MQLVPYTFNWKKEKAPRADSHIICEAEYFYIGKWKVGYVYHIFDTDKGYYHANIKLPGLEEQMNYFVKQTKFETQQVAKEAVEFYGKHWLNNLVFDK